MRIAFDMGDTICSTQEKILEYEKIFCNKYNLDLESLRSSKKYHEKFMIEYASIIYRKAKIKSNVKKSINKLYDEGNEIYILTSRSSRYDKDMFNLTELFFKENKIKYTKIVIDCSDKVVSCIDNDISIMMEDNINTFKRLIDNKIFCILYDENNKFPLIYNRITNWNQLYDMLKMYNKI